jgi:uncharacterized membrane protein YhaH (DUF805 family)
MANDVNPYRAPAATVADAGHDTQPVKLFSISGRIGRARYIAYGFGLYFVFMFTAGVVAGTLGDAGFALMAVAWLAMAVLGIMLTIQRCHDFNMTGWLSLVIVVPLANMMFLFIPGTDGPNRFGAPTPANSIGVLIVAWLIPAVALAGIIAAIAIPASQR